MTADIGYRDIEDRSNTTKRLVIRVGDQGSFAAGNRPSRTFPAVSRGGVKFSAFQNETAAIVFPTDPVLGADSWPTPPKNVFVLLLLSLMRHMATSNDDSLNNDQHGRTLSLIPVRRCARAFEGTTTAFKVV
jgi:hypothetical protein